MLHYVYCIEKKHLATIGLLQCLAMEHPKTQFGKEKYLTKPYCEVGLKLRVKWWCSPVFRQRQMWVSVTDTAIILSNFWFMSVGTQSSIGLAFFFGFARPMSMRVWSSTGILLTQTCFKFSFVSYGQAEPGLPASGLCVAWGWWWNTMRA